MSSLELIVKAFGDSKTYANLTRKDACLAHVLRKDLMMRHRDRHGMGLEDERARGTPCLVSQDLVTAVCRPTLAVNHAFQEIRDLYNAGEEDSYDFFAGFKLTEEQRKLKRIALFQRLENGDMEAARVDRLLGKKKKKEKKSKTKKKGEESEDEEEEEEEDQEEEEEGKKRGRKKKNDLDGFVVDDSDEDGEDSEEDSEDDAMLKLALAESKLVAGSKGLSSNTSVDLNGKPSESSAFVKKTKRTGPFLDNIIFKWESITQQALQVQNTSQSIMDRELKALFEWSSDNGRKIFSELFQKTAEI